MKVVNIIKRTLGVERPSRRKDPIMFISDGDIGRFTVRCKCGAIYNMDPTTDLTHRDRVVADGQEFTGTWWNSKCPNCGKNHSAFLETVFYFPK